MPHAASGPEGAPGIATWIEAAALQRTAREFFLRDYPPPRIRAMDAAGEIAPTLWQDLDRLG
jgi:hypothetical protein